MQQVGRGVRASREGSGTERLALIHKRGITLDRTFNNSMITRRTIFHKMFLIISVRDKA